MKTLLILLLLITPAYSAELLVMAKDSCADKLCNRKGDIIQVEADGHDWEGTCKVCKAPNFQIIKMPKVTIEEARTWLEPLMEEKTRTVEGKEEPYSEQIRDRKYSLPASAIDAIKFTGKDTLAVSEKNVATYKAQITAKTVSAEKVIDEKVISK